MRSPEVSVVIATYNHGRFLTGALRSVLAQTFDYFEILIIDDGSTDATRKIVRPFLTDPRIHYQRTDPCGASAARNRGIARSQAPLIAFLDADDVWLPEKLRLQVDLFHSDPGLGVVYSRRQLINEEGWGLQYAQPSLYRGFVLPQLFVRNFLCFSSGMVLRSALVEIGGFDEELRLAVDFDLWLRLARTYRFDYVDEPLVLYRTGHESLSRRRRERINTVEKIMRRFSECDGREFLDPAVIGLARAELCCDRAAVVDTTSRVQALGCYLEALTYRPHHLAAWRGLLSCWWPESARRLVRGALGRADWRTRPPVSPPMPLAIPTDPPSPAKPKDSSMSALVSTTVPLPTTEPPRRPGLVASVAANWVGFAAQMAAAFVLSPILLHGLGDHRYGIWALLDSILAYLTLFDLGVAASVVRYVARFEAIRDEGSLRKVFSTSLAIFAAAGLGVFGLAALVAFTGLGLLGVPDDLISESRMAFLLLGLNLAVGLPLGVYACALDGLGRYPAKTLVRTTGLLFRCVIVWYLMKEGAGISALAATALVFGLLEHLTMAVVVRAYLPALRFSFRAIDRATFHTIKGYSLDALLAMVAGRICFQTDAIVIGRFLPTPYITFFALAARLVEYAKDSLRVATSVLTPAVSALEARGDQEGIRTVLLNSTRYALWLILPVQLGLLILGRPFLSLWLGSEYADRSYPTLVILAIPLSLAVAQSVAVRILYGSGRIRWFARIALGEAVANLVLSVLLVRPYGIEGVALGTAIPNVLVNCAVVAFSCRGLKINAGHYLRRSILVPCLAASVLGLSWMAMTQFMPMMEWAGFLAVGAAGVVAYGSIALLAEFGPGGLVRLQGDSSCAS